MISSPSGESEANTVTGSTSAGSLEKAQNIIHHFKYGLNTFIHLRENILDKRLGFGGQMVLSVCALVLPICSCVTLFSCSELVFCFATG